MYSFIKKTILLLIIFLSIGLGYLYFRSNSILNKTSQFHPVYIDTTIGKYRGAIQSEISNQSKLTDYLKAYQLYQSQNYSEAIHLANQHLGQNPEDTKAIFLKAHCYFQLGNLEQAQECCELVRMNDPGLYESATRFLTLSAEDAGDIQSRNWYADQLIP